MVTTRRNTEAIFLATPLERHFLSHGAGSNGVKNVIIAFPVHMHRTAGILDLVLDDVLQSDSSSLIGEL